MAFRLLARPLSQHLRPQLGPQLTRSLASKRHRGNQNRDSGAFQQDGDRTETSLGSERRPERPERPSEPIDEPDAPIEPPVSPPPPASQPEPSQVEPEVPEQPLPASSLPSLDFAPGVPPQGGRTGARAAGGSTGPTADQRRAGRILTFVFAVGVGAGIWHLGRDWEPDELKRRRKNPLPMGTGFWAFWARAKTRTMEITGLFREPAWEELLPPPMPPPHQKPYTLLLSVDDLLVTSTWDRTHGWRTAKRPGVDYFLAYMSQFYEIVIFTSQPYFHAGPITEKLDPYQFYVMYKLFREATRFVDGHVVKDISFLNRDPSKVVALDTHAEHFSLQPENALIVPPWRGEAGDKGLIALIPFLESIGIYKPEDVRPILSKYAGKDVAVEYAKQEAEHKRAFLEDWHAKNRGRSMPGAGLSSGGFTLSKLFTRSDNRLGASGPEPLTYLEQKRLEAQQLYLEEQAYLKKNEGEIKRMMEDDLKERERMAREQGNSLMAVMGALINGPPGVPPPPAPASGEKKS
ncbi:HAD-like protein [Exidia glandulosa HHB12029]|uniref:Mitochondrial import inner membrane translocase subunit TIM50 n=1 Tax=Exidia glandulosa HHB12029 TaxID=1314781 RepID=A0A166MWX4_EXIGL|nr:HAD-like protein [Exidia glandulosa HHB12029]